MGQKQMKTKASLS